jgi:phospholipid/cholesterol/gamma-HCH transport system permease protein
MFFFQHLGAIVLDSFADSGRAGLLLARILRSMVGIPRSLRLIIQQMFIIGNGSVPLVLVTSVFTGAVTTVQAHYQFQGYVPVRMLGTVVAKSVVIELGPVLTALVVGARVGASIAAELGTMKVTEQIDALEMMAIDPVRYLAMPRFVAACIMLPVLTIFADTVAIGGGWLVAVNSLGVSSKIFTDGLRFLFDVHDVYGGLIKAFTFGAIIALSGCVHGFHARGGAAGVGEAAMRAVVMSSLLILITDYILAAVIFQVLWAR